MSTDAQVNVGNNLELGDILVDRAGMTLYIFTQDGPNQSNCTGELLQYWPPLLTDGDPQVGLGVDQSLLGSTVLEDGTQIVTYNQRPLYYWAGDNQPGDTNGEGVGGVWFTISPAGNPVGE